MNKLLCAIALIAIANVGTWFQFQGHYWSDKPFFKSNDLGEKTSPIADVIQMGRRKTVTRNRPFISVEFFFKLNKIPPIYNNKWEFK